VWCFWKLVGRDVVSFFNDFGWLVLDLSCNLRISDSFKKLGNLGKGIFKVGLLVLLHLLFCGEANLLQDPLALLTGSNSGVRVVEEDSEFVELLEGGVVVSEADVECNAESKCQ